MKLIMIIAMLFFVGCEQNEDGTDFFVNLRVVEGHKYITYSNGRGCCIIHSESCKCKGETK